MLTEQLQKIIDGKLTGENARVILGDAIGEIEQSWSRYEQLGLLVRQAELRLAYGEAGRPGRQLPSFS